MNALLLANAAGPEGAVEVGKEVTQKAVVAGQATWERVATQMTDLMSGYLPNAAAALVVLIVGWIAALVIATVVRAALRKLGIDRRFSESVPTDGTVGRPEISRRIGKGVFYLIMIFVLVAFFQTLGLTAVTEPLTAFLNQVFEYAPRLIAAGVLLFLAWVVATVLRFVVRQALTAAKIDRRLTREAGGDQDEDFPVTKTLSDATYWLVYLLFLPALLRSGRTGPARAGERHGDQDPRILAKPLCRGRHPRYRLVCRPDRTAGSDEPPRRRRHRSAQ